MVRPKIKDKKITMSLTINELLNEKLNKYLEEKKLSKSEYIENLIKKDKNIDL
jgi:hypothetical protein